MDNRISGLHKMHTIDDEQDTFTPLTSTGNTQEAMATSRHD